MGEELYAHDVTDKESFCHFLELVLSDFKERGDQWPNNRLELFLEGLRGFSIDMDGLDLNKAKGDNQNEISWKVLSEMIKGAIVYE